MNAAAYERLFDLLDRSQLQQPAIDAVLAAADGAEALTASLDGLAAPAAPERTGAPDAEAAPVYLEEVAVEGFRASAIGRACSSNRAPG